MMLMKPPKIHLMLLWTHLAHLALTETLMMLTPKIHHLMLLLAHPAHLASMENGDGPFDNSEVVEFDPIANRGPFDDDDDVEDEDVQTAPPSIANKSATKDTSATLAAPANESSLPASTPAASAVAAPSAVADTSPTEDTSATPPDSLVESSLPAIPALPANVPIIMGPHHNSSRAEYLAMPSEQVYCSAVDTVNGLYYDCWLCGSKGCDYRVKSRRPFTLYSWTQHEGTGMHTDAVAREKEKKRISDKVKSKDPNRICITYRDY
eukprot:scaffold184828_cov57-Cyclotella_meneghiniana.AAC.2